MDCKDITHNGNASNDSNGINNLADVVNGAYFNKPESLNVGNIQIKDSSKVHIGPKFISINHDVTEDTLKGITHEDFLTKIKSATRVKKIAFSGILLSMIASVSVIIYFSIDNNFIRYIDDDDGQTEWFIKREMWLARFYNSSNPVTHQPLKLVIINHSASIECHKFITCAAEVRSIQNYYLDKLNYDLPYNFIIGNDGRVYEGRGWYYTGAHTKYYNNCSIGLGFTGDYRKITMNTLITKKQIESTNKLLEEGVAAGHLHANYVIVGHKDIYASESPGDNLYSVMQTWEHYNNKIFKNKTCLDIDNTELDKSHNTDTTSII